MIADAAETLSYVFLKMPTYGAFVVEMWNGLSPGITAASSTSFLIVVLTILWLLSTYSQANSKVRLPPGSLGLPLIGQTLQFSLAVRGGLSYPQWIREKTRKYGPIFKTHILGKPIVFLDAPAGNKFIFQNEGKLVEHELPPSIEKLLGPLSLVTKHGEEYKITRRHVASFLDHAAVLRYLDVLERNAVQHLAKHWSGKDDLSAMEMMKKFTLTTICTLLFSLSDGPDVDFLVANFNIWSVGVFWLPINLPGFAYYDACKARVLILDWFHKFITQRRQELAEGRLSESSKVDPLHRLLTTPDENGRFLSDPEIWTIILTWCSLGTTLPAPH